jgi:hypothetical protein
MKQLIGGYLLTTGGSPGCKDKGPGGEVREVREYRGWENNCWGLWKGEELVRRGKRVDG